MLYLILFLIAGIAVGVAFHKQNRISIISERLTTITVYLLLFVLGLKAGSDKNITSQLQHLGLTALGITLFTIGGSIFMAYFINRFISKKVKK